VVDSIDGYAGLLMLRMYTSKVAFLYNLHSEVVSEVTLLSEFAASGLQRTDHKLLYSEV
jgi:hypothetical protein